MRKLFLSTSLTLVIISLASAQEKQPVSSGVRLTPPANAERPTSAALGIVPDSGKTGAYILQPGRYDLRELLVTLAEKAGRKAIFEDKFGTTEWRTAFPLRGTLQELVGTVSGRNGIIVSKTGEDWVFKRVPTVLLLPPVLLERKTLTPLKPFNINPNPGKNLPPDAKPFEFNGSKLYHVPVK